MGDHAELAKHLMKMAKITNEEWLTSLAPRKRRELEFHDRDRDRMVSKTLSDDDFEKYYANKKYYKTTALSVNYVDSYISTHCPGKVFLDYACGNGSNAIKAAKAGASISLGLDISAVSVKNATADAAKAGVTNAHFFQADAENTRLPDESVDLIVCSGMLHHLDLSHAFPELRRILAPGGIILAVEALNYNPFIKAYRFLTPSMRTDWEKHHILSLKDIRFANRFFDVGEVRYWHVLSYAGAFMPKLLPLLDRIDSVLTRIPIIRLMAWIFTFELLKKDEALSHRS